MWCNRTCSSTGSNKPAVALGDSALSRQEWMDDVSSGRDQAQEHMHAGADPIKVGQAKL